MRLKNKISITKAICEARLFKKKTPLMASWALSYRCNRRCIYCRIWELSRKELSTPEVISMIDKFSSLGTQCITFTGGEPLMREDIGEIITYASRKGIFIKINSNGSMIPRRISVLAHLNSLSLSFDGPEEIQDYIRGEGSYAEVIEAVRVAKGYGINVSFLTVLSKVNLNSIDFILESAKKFQVAVLFQPATSLLLGSGEKNPISCSSNEYEQAIRKLIANKRINRYNILNSTKGLWHLCHWPNQRSLPCAAGKISFRVEPNGEVHSCFKQVSHNLADIFCNDCWCGTQVEINYLSAWNINAILNSIRWV
ncbi:MAG: radical SAM protein [Candidatus Omnitrophica bacterium]|nr:radical SAM protein [Candidatus Omnitrophota bacterium]MBU4467736.1 radical SAM protein [Candidatus Omnitrophota bacterium]MCG2707046.1 radical SAM protein [Candidatus Omnitrophota bacterium]